jgi:two-component system chemotaxis response regulator CheY
MGPKILTVDDSKSIRDMIAFTLEPKGYTVVGAEDGVAGLAALQGQKIDMVVCDVNMPNMDGIEMVRQARKLPALAGIPIVMLTTEGQKEKMIAAKEAGATGWLVKPFDEAKLLGVIDKMIG